jgi:hypothetical protein
MRASSIDLHENAPGIERPRQKIHQILTSAQRILE